MSNKYRDKVNFVSPSLVIGYKMYNSFRNIANVPTSDQAKSGELSGESSDSLLMDALTASGLNADESEDRYRAEALASRLSRDLVAMSFCVDERTLNIILKPTAKEWYKNDDV